ncbi:type 1 fimbrial protein, partial [Lelliottia sp. AC1]|uniref:fimbrial protein n=1 Tax=Lelliottia sp. AC1 TaxID=2067959 RepID=UPI00353249E1
VDLGEFRKSSSGSFPREGKLTRFGMDFTCSSYTNNVEFTFDEPYTIVPGRETISAVSDQNGQKLKGLEVGLYNSEGKVVRMGVKQNIGVGQKGKNTAYFQAAVIQTAPQITDASDHEFTGAFTAKVNVTITYY